MLGVLARFGIGRLTFHHEWLIWSTVGINIVGSFLLGLLVAEHWFTRDLREGIGVGFLAASRRSRPFPCRSCLMSMPASPSGPSPISSRPSSVGARGDGGLRARPLARVARAPPAGSLLAPAGGPWDGQAQMRRQGLADETELEEAPTSATPEPARSRATELLALQQTAGNAAVSRMLARWPSWPRRRRP